MFAIADRLEWREGSPVARVDAPKAVHHDPIIAEAGQYDDLLKACKCPMMRLYALLLGETGMRCDSERLTTALREHLLRYKAAKYRGELSPWVLHHTHGGPRYKAGARIKDFHAGFKAVAETAKLPPELRQHDLRHSRITWWLADGK
jgi:integrase